MSELGIGDWGLAQSPIPNPQVFLICLINQLILFIIIIIIIII